MLRPLKQQRRQAVAQPGVAKSHLFVWRQGCGLRRGGSLRFSKYLIRSRSERLEFRVLLKEADIDPVRASRKYTTAPLRNTVAAASRPSVST
jgi:hypothetical protein